MLKKYDAYKDSGLPSFGHVPKHWEIIPLCSITTLKSITNVVNEELLSVYLDKGVIRFDDVTEKRTNVTSLDLSKYQLVEEGDFVLNNQQAWRGSVGVSIYRGIVSPAYLVLKLSPKVDTKFANYFFRNTAMVSQYLINSKGVGTIQRNLYWQHLKRSNVVLPPTQEQTQIAEFLDQKTSEIDQAIAIKEQQIALLNERKQIVIQKAVTQGLNPNVAMKDSGVEWIGKIPEHWEIQKLSYLAKLDSGSTPDRSNLNFWSNGTIPWLKTGEINYNLIESSEEFVTPLALSKTALKLAPKGTLLMAMYGQGITRGRVAILNFEATYNQACCAIQCKSKLINWYLFHFFVFAYSFIRDGGNETSQMNISTGYISNLKVVLPPVEEQLQIISYLDSEMEKYEEAKLNLKQQIEKLKEYKTTLINDAVTGKIKVA